jgi:hypothetical protein
MLDLPEPVFNGFHAQGVNSNGFPSGVTLQFDPAAVEVKAVYRPLGGVLTKENCHWNYAADGKAYGLVALHIMSKQIPNWTFGSGPAIRQISRTAIRGDRNTGVDSAGAPNPSIGFTLDGQSRNGPLDPAWFYDLNNFDPTQQFGRYKVIYYPVDFVWAIFKAQPKKRQVNCRNFRASVVL